MNTEVFWTIRKRGEEYHLLLNGLDSRYGSIVAIKMPDDKNRDDAFVQVGYCLM